MAEAATGKLTLAVLKSELDGTSDMAAAAMEGVTRLNQQVVDAREGLPQQRLDHFLARLEKVEQNTKGATHNWGPAIDTLVQADNDLLEKVKSLQQRVTAAEEITAPEQGGLLDDVWRALEALQQKVLEQPTPVASPPVGNYTAAVGSPTVGGVGAKVHALMLEVEHIAKSKTAKIETRGDSYEYKFRGIDQAQDAVGAAMRKVGLILRTEIIEKDYRLTPVERKYANGGSQTQLWSTCVLTIRYVFVDPSDMSEFPFEMTGEGKDLSDKASSKAASMACKYGLFQALMIPVKGVNESDGENPEITSENEAPAAPARQEQQAPPKQDQPAPDTASAKQVRAAAAVEAAKVLHTLPDAQDAMNRLNGITQRVKEEGLMDIKVGDLPVSEWINSVWKVLKGLLSFEGRGTQQGATRSDVDPGASAQPQQDIPPTPQTAPDDPWGSYTPPGGEG